MPALFHQIPLYRFIACCEDTHMEKTILDCEAGGDLPPLALFHQHHYTVAGIDNDKQQIERANAYAKSQQIQLNIQQGDMRALPFDDDSFSFVYSYNSIFHMTKADIKTALHEMQRVLKPHGLMFVNFLTVHDFRCGSGEALGQHQYLQWDDDQKVIHAYFDEAEADQLVQGMKILVKENRIIERCYQGQWIRQGFFDYILQKK